MKMRVARVVQRRKDADLAARVYSSMSIRFRQVVVSTSFSITRGKKDIEPRPRGENPLAD